MLRQSLLVRFVLPVSYQHLCTDQFNCTGMGQKNCSVTDGSYELMKSVQFVAHPVVLWHKLNCGCTATVVGQDYKIAFNNKFTHSVCLSWPA